MLETASCCSLSIHLFTVRDLCVYKYRRSRFCVLMGWNLQQFFLNAGLTKQFTVNCKTLQHRFAYFETPSRTGIIRKLPVYLSQVEEHLSILQSVLFNWCTSQMSQKFAKRQAGAANIGTPSRTGIVRKLPVYL
jgi:hypothetical protein